MKRATRRAFVEVLRPPFRGATHGLGIAHLLVWLVPLAILVAGFATGIGALAAVSAVAAVLVVLLVSAFAAVRRAQEQLIQLEEAPRPYLVFLEPEHDTAATYRGELGIEASASASASWSASAAGPSSFRSMVARALSVNEYVRINVANDPPPGRRGSRAEKVVARVDFMSPAGSSLIPQMLGRWAETPQRVETGRLGLDLDHAQLDIEPNGLPHPIDIAAKRLNASGPCFAFNDKNSGAPDLLLPEHKLEGSEIRVRVELRAANSDTIVANFVLRNADSQPLDLVRQ